MAAEGDALKRGEASKVRPEPPKEAKKGGSPANPRRNEVSEKTVETLPRAVGGSEVFLASTSYIDDTAEAALEARRVSKALKQFRWNVTPPYAISTIFSDLLCITSESGSISKALIEKIEGLGYTFSGFEASNSRPLAWFKRREEPGHPAQAQAPADTAQLDDLARTIQDQGAEIEKEMARLDKERREIAENLKTLTTAGQSSE